MSPGSQGGQEWILGPLELHHIWLGAAMWVLGIELGSSGRAACALSLCKTPGISPALSNHFLSIYACSRSSVLFSALQATTPGSVGHLYQPLH